VTDPHPSHSADPRHDGDVRSEVYALNLTFAAAGIDPLVPELRERFGDDHRWLRQWRERTERRVKWTSAAVTTIVVALLTALLTTSGPFLIRLVVVLINGGEAK
jgi:hypothetical protein